MNFPDEVPSADAINTGVRAAIFPPAVRYHGVTNVGRGKAKFLASVHAGRTYKLGVFDTAAEAATVYDAARVLLGKQKRNFPDADPGAAAIDTARRAIYPAAGRATEPAPS